MDYLTANHVLADLQLRIIEESLIIDILWIRAMVMRDDWTIDRHMHEAYEFHFVMHGQCKVILDNQSFEVTEGEFYLTPPGVYHTQQNIGQDEFVEYCLCCDIKLIHEQKSATTQLYNALQSVDSQPYKDTEGCLGIFKQIFFEALQQRLNFYNIIKHLVCMLLTVVIRTLRSDVSLIHNIPYKAASTDDRLAAIRRFIRDHMSMNITIADIAKYVHLSEKQIYRTVKGKKGISVKELILQIKMRESRRLLTQTNLPIKQIAVMLGFSSVCYFNQFFKHRQGKAPSSYREESQLSKNSKIDNNKTNL